jgi:hypothetical protein
MSSISILSLNLNWLCVGMHQLLPGMYGISTRYEYAYQCYAYLGISIHERPNVHTNNHTSCPDMHEHWLLCACISPDIYKDGFFFKIKFWIWLHAYLGTIQLHIQIFPYFQATLVGTHSDTHHIVLTYYLQIGVFNGLQITITPP